MSLKKNVLSHWREFANSSSFHGVKEIFRSPSLSQKIIWLIVVTTCAFAFSYHTYRMASNYASEKTITDVTVLRVPFTKPRVMIGFPLHRLFRLERQLKDSQLPELEPKVVRILQGMLKGSICESVTDSAVRSNISWAIRVLQDYMTVNNVTWAETIEPNVLDLRKWIMHRQGASGNPPLHISRRYIWYPTTYHLVEPKPDSRSSSAYNYSYMQSFDLILDWNQSPLDEDEGCTTVVGYELVNDQFLLKKGGKYKLSFDISGNARLNLRRRPCVESDDYAIRRFDLMACVEKCYLESMLEKFPFACFFLPDTRYSLLDVYPRGRPCLPGSVSIGRDDHNSTSKQSDINVPLDEIWGRLTKTATQSLLHDVRICEESRCQKRCNELTVHYQLNVGALAEDEPENITILALEWPTSEGVIIYEEKYFYKICGLVGEWGGLASVFLGASVISFFEIIYFCCWCLVDAARTLNHRGMIDVVH